MKHMLADRAKVPLAELWVIELQRQQYSDWQSGAGYADECEYDDVDSKQLRHGLGQAIDLQSHHLL